MEEKYALSQALSKRGALETNLATMALVLEKEKGIFVEYDIKVDI